MPQVLGRGVGSDLLLSPPTVVALGGSALGAEVAQTVVLTNPNGSPRQWCWLPEEVDSAYPAPHVTVEPAEGILDAEGEAELTIKLRGDVPGCLRRTLLFGCSPHGRTLRLPVAISVVRNYVVGIM